MSPIRVLFCASEMTPFAKTGGLADVVGALPIALKDLGLEVSCIMPYYGRAMHKTADVKPTGKRFTVRLGADTEEFAIRRARAGGVPVYFLESKAMFDRPGLYGENGRDYPDNCRRFAFLSMACLAAADSLGLNPDVYHVHDWQTALLPVYLSRRTDRAARSILTVHNLAFQGVIPAEEFHQTGLDESYFHWQRLEYYGKANVLKGGIVFAHAITTVSPTYAHEIQQPEFGCGLEGVLRDRADRLWGILNGIDGTVWNPETDPYLPAPYSPRDLRGKAVCRAAICAEAGIRPVSKPLMGVVTRLTEQKGIDILLPVLKTLLAEGHPCVVLGTGDPAYETRLAELKEAFPARLGLFLTFDNRLAHLIEAGSDMFLMPSRFEPCGLNQFYSMRYGTVPVVRATGGLADSVSPFSKEGVAQGRSTGFVFRAYSPAALLETVREATAAFADKDLWNKLIRNGMAQVFDWRHSAERYHEVYRKLQER